MNIKLIEEYDKSVITKELLDIISNQMDFINSHKSINEIDNFLMNYLNGESNAKLLILEEDNIIGFAFFNISIGLETLGKYIWLNELHILDKYQKKGYGKLILSYVEEHAKNQGIKKIMGLVSKDNNATKFYTSNNYELNDYYLFDK